MSPSATTGGRARYRRKNRGGGAGGDVWARHPRRLRCYWLVPPPVPVPPEPVAPDPVAGGAVLAGGGEVLPPVCCCSSHAATPSRSIGTAKSQNLLRIGSTPGRYNRRCRLKR